MIQYNKKQTDTIHSTMMLLSNRLLWMQHNNNTILPDRCDACSSFEFYQDYFFEFMLNFESYCTIQQLMCFKNLNFDLLHLQEIFLSIAMNSSKSD